MTDQWTAVDQYLADTIVKPDSALDKALADSDTAGLPSIAVPPGHGKLLQILARLVNARTILEIGTLGGYSAIWLARALKPGGRLISLEADAKHAELARANIARAGLQNVVDVRLGAALETLPQIADEKIGPFDLVFIDADKPNTPRYFTWALRLARVGSIRSRHECWQRNIRGAAEISRPATHSRAASLLGPSKSNRIKSTQINGRKAPRWGDFPPISFERGSCLTVS